MKRVWLVLDMNNLAWRAFHVFKNLAYAGTGTGATYGMLKDIHTLMDFHATRHIAFCFDHGESKRKKINKAYKFKRHNKELTEEEKEQYADLRKQIHVLKTKILPKLGFKNIFYQEGYEADDMIASVVKSLGNKDEAVVVSSDKDMHQLLSPKCFIWNPIKKECLTDEMFTKQWGLVPRKWANVKALAGCLSDEIKGVKGIGEKTAAAIFRKEMNDNKRIKKLVLSNTDLYSHNLRLVKLPLEGAKTSKLVEDEVSKSEWKKLTKKLGMRSIAGRVPGMITGFGLKPVKIKEKFDEG